MAPRDGLALPPAVDVEYTGNCAGWESLDDVRRELFVFIRHAEAQLGHPLLLYTTEDVWRELVPPELVPPEPLPALPPEAKVPAVPGGGDAP